jgi:ribonuclease P protein component
VVTPAFVLQARAQPEGLGACPRVGFTASRKVGGAVKRNRARRRLKALAAGVLAARARPGWDYVFVARAEATGRPWPLLVADLTQALDRIERGPSAASEAP